MRALAPATLACLTWLSTVGGAATWAAGASPPPPAAAARPADLDEAQRHFKLALTLYADNDFPAARAELEHAYKLVPTYKILYNLGQVLYQLHDYAGALRTFQAYLSGGGDEISLARRNEVTAELRRLTDRTGRLDLGAFVSATVVLVDDVEVDRNARATPLLANVGQRRIEVVFPHGERATRLVELAAGQTVTVALPFPQRRLALDAPNRPVSPALAGTSLVRRDAEEPTRPRAAWANPAWLGWGATAVLAAAAGVTGGLAYGASRQVQRDFDAFPVDSTQLDRDRQRVRTFAFVSDGLLAGAALAASLSLYLTLQDHDREGHRDRSGTHRASR